METINDRIQHLIDIFYSGRQSNMVKAIGVHKSELSRLLNGGNISMLWVERLHNAHPEIDLHWLITGEGEMHYESRSIKGELASISKKLEKII